MFKIASKFSLNEQVFFKGLKTQFNLNKCIVTSIDSKVVVIAFCEGNLYQMNFIKVMRVTNIRQHFPTIGRGKKINVVKIVHLNVYCPIVKIFISSARYFVKGVDVHVEVQRVVLGKFQGVESFCWDTTETKNWGTSIGYWWWSHFGQIPSFLEWIWKLKKPKICSTPTFKHNCNDGMQPKFGVHGGGQTLEKEEYSTKECRPCGEWWKTHILPQHDEILANVAYFGDFLKLCENMEFAKERKQSLSNNENPFTTYETKMLKVDHQLLVITRWWFLELWDWIRFE